MPRNNITQHELARLAGVSQKTVYRALHSKERVGAQTQLRIRELAAKLKYRPDIGAQSMYSGRYRNVAILAHREMSRRSHRSSDLICAAPTYPLSQYYLIGVNDILAEQGYCLSISYVDVDVHQQQVPRTFDHLRFDGVIALVELGAEIRRVLEELALPVVRVNPQSPSSETRVLVDDFAVGRMMTTHLIERGHHRIALLHGSSIAMPYATERQRGYLAAMAQADLPAHGSAHVYAPREQRSEYWEQLLGDHKDRPSAFVAINPDLAVDFMMFTARRNECAGRDYSFACMHDIPSFAFTQPPVTAVELPEYEMGRTAAQIMLQKLEKPEMRFEDRLLTPRLVERASVQTLQDSETS